MFCQVAVVGMNASLVKKNMEMTLADLNLQENVKDSPESARYNELFDMFASEKINVFKEILEGMHGTIEQTADQIWKERKLDTLDLKLYDENE